MYVLQRLSALGCSSKGRRSGWQLLWRSWAKCGCPCAGAGVAQEVIDRVAELVDRGCRLCQNAMRAEGIKVPCLSASHKTHVWHVVQ